MTSPDGLYGTGVPLTDGALQAFRCPDCGCGRFDLILGGRRNGRIECSDCGRPVLPGDEDDAADAARSEAAAGT